MNKQLFTVLTFTKISTKRFFRDRLAIFFSIAFPLIFLFVFGAISGSSNGVSFKVAVINESHSAFSQKFVQDLSKNKIFKVDKSVTTTAQAEDKMSKSQIDGTIVLPQNFGDTVAGQTYPGGKAQVVYTQNNASAGQTLTSILDQTLKGVNMQYVKAPVPFSVESKQSNTQSLSAFDYTFSGLLGFSIIGLGVFGPINVFPELKKQGILRRLRTTQLKVWQYFVSTMLSQAAIGLVAISIQFAVAIAVFHLKVVGNYLEIAAFVVLSIFLILGIGLAVGGWSKNERQAAPLGNAIVFPLLFLSGTFFPRFLMPEWLQNITAYLPLTPVIDGLRLMATEGKHLIDLGPQLAVMAVWTVVIYFIAFKVFRWE
ncbi:ABC transporter permease [Candidatus Saccharibacteria bacterium]|nr:ABC transporter permease [Candidatus Saccharibacteria bacterium]